MSSGNEGSSEEEEKARGRKRRLDADATYVPSEDGSSSSDKAKRPRKRKALRADETYVPSENDDDSSDGDRAPRRRKRRVRRVVEDGSADAAAPDEGATREELGLASPTPSTAEAVSPVLRLADDSDLPSLAAVVEPNTRSPAHAPARTEDSTPINDDSVVHSTPTNDDSGVQTNGPAASAPESVNATVAYDSDADAAEDKHTPAEMAPPAAPPPVPPPPAAKGFVKQKPASFWARVVSFLPSWGSKSGDGESSRAAGSPVTPVARPAAGRAAAAARPPDMSAIMIPHEEITCGELISEGTHGKVYRAWWNGMEVCCKYLKSTNTEKSLRMFEREVHLLRKLRHPNVVLFMGACVQDGHRCIVTEYVERGSLTRFLSELDGPPALDVALRLMRDIALGLNYLHLLKPKIIHRDLKPDNLLVDNGGVVKITDFGISKERHDTNETMMTGFIGTVAYMSPEVIRNERYTEAVDVYSFGIVSWQILTNEVPFRDLKPIQLAFKVEQGVRPRIPSSCPPRLASVIERCWHHEGVARPPLRDVIPELDTVAAEHRARS